MKHFTLLTLLVFAAPFGWGEEELVFYCVEDYGAEVSSSGSKLMPKSELKRVTYKISDKVYQGSSLKRWNITTRQDIFVQATSVDLSCVNVFQLYRKSANTGVGAYVWKVNVTKSCANTTVSKAGTCTKF